MLFFIFYFLVLLYLLTSIYLKTKKRENLIRFQFGFQFLSNFVSHIPSNFIIIFFFWVSSELFNAKYEASNINEP